MSSTSLKILVCGDVNGKYKQLFDRVIQVNRKSGPFEMVLCVGEFFGIDCDQEYNDLIHGSLELPSIPVYILGPIDERLTKYYRSNDSMGNDFDSGFELIDGLTYLGRRGILTSCGLRIAYLSGKQTTDNNNDHKNTFNIKDYESLLLSHQSSSAIVDILMTSQWPKHVFRYSEGHQKQLEEQNQELGSELVAKLSLLMRPRYHFVGGYNTFYERHPFRNHKVLAESARHVTRFISLASVGNKTKDKWLYAFGITPASLMDKNELIKQPIDVTENPFIDLMNDQFNKNSDNRVNTSEPSTQFFYDLSRNNEDNQSFRSNNKRKRQHNNNEFRDNKQRQSDCWFCLASPQVEKHLIISIGDHSYLAMAKGGLTDDHLLILPIEHLRSTIEIDNEDVINEINKFKEALNKYFDSKGQSVVFFERNFKSSHLQIQVIGIPKVKALDMKTTILELVEERGLKFNELSDECQLKDVLNAGLPYFYIEMPNAKLFTRIKTSEYFPIQIGRELLAHPLILNCMDKIDWKQCSLSKEEAINIANKIRKDFEPFDFTLI
jgi:diadenosine tetraphosphate (Ap4A) HIT family hydrolase